MGNRLSRAYLRSAFWRSAKCFWWSIVASSWLNSFLNAFDASAKRSAWSSASRLYLAAASLDVEVLLDRLAALERLLEAAEGVGACAWGFGEDTLSASPAL